MANRRPRPQRRNRGSGARPAEGGGRLRPAREAEAEAQAEAARRERDLGLDDLPADDGMAGSTPAPDPLKHASAEVDAARLAEAGAAHPDRPGEELQDDEDDDRARERDDGPGGVPARTEPERSGAVAFLRHSADELRRVQWPNRRQVGQATAVVLGFVVLAGGYLGLLDALWRPLVEAIL